MRPVGWRWKTANGGVTWNALTDNQSTLFMGAIALAPSDPSVIYAGTGDANLGPDKLAFNRDNIFYGEGVLKSTDAGATWTLLGNNVFDRRTISKIVVDPTDPNTVYVAVGAVATNGLPGNTAHLEIDGRWADLDRHHRGHLEHGRLLRSGDRPDEPPGALCRRWRSLWRQLQWYLQDHQRRCLMGGGKRRPHWCGRSADSPCYPGPWRASDPDTLYASSSPRARWILSSTRPAPCTRC